MSPASLLTVLDLATDLVGVATKIPGAVERVRAWVEGDGERPDDVLGELPDGTRNHIEQARIEKLAAGGTGGA